MNTLTIDFFLSNFYNFCDHFNFTQSLPIDHIDSYFTNKNQPLSINNIIELNEILKNNYPGTIFLSLYYEHTNPINIQKKHHYQPKIYINFAQPTVPAMFIYNKDKVITTDKNFFLSKPNQTDFYSVLHINKIYKLPEDYIHNSTVDILNNYPLMASDPFIIDKKTIDKHIFSLYQYYQSLFSLNISINELDELITTSTFQPTHTKKTFHKSNNTIADILSKFYGKDIFIYFEDNEKNYCGGFQNTLLTISNDPFNLFDNYNKSFLIYVINIDIV